MSVPHPCSIDRHFERHGWPRDASAPQILSISLTPSISEILHLLLPRQGLPCSSPSELHAPPQIQFPPHPSAPRQQPLAPRKMTASDSNTTLQAQPEGQSELAAEAAENNTKTSFKRGLHFWGTFVALCCLSFISALDVAIVTTALPTVTEAIGGAEQYVWIANSFVVASCVLQPLFGQLAKCVFLCLFCTLPVCAETNAGEWQCFWSASALHRVCCPFHRWQRDRRRCQGCCHVDRGTGHPGRWGWGHYCVAGYRVLRLGAAARKRQIPRFDVLVVRCRCCFGASSKSR